MSKSVFHEGERYIIRYWPRYFYTYSQPYVRARHTKIEEMIFRKGRFESWTGEYTHMSTNTVSLEDVVSLISDTKEVPYE